MAEAFSRPILQIAQQNTFSNSEVGVTHPQHPSYVRLLDNGDVEIMAKDGVGIIMSAASHTITFVGHAVRFLTTDKNGIVWNRTAFNEQATTFNEPALFNLADTDLQQMFQGTENFISGGG